MRDIDHTHTLKHNGKPTSLQRKEKKKKKKKFGKQTRKRNFMKQAENLLVID